MSIASLLHEYEIALNTKDTNRILTLYGNDPVFMAQGAPAFIGRDAVRVGYVHVFATLKLNVKFTIHDMEESGDWAWVRTSSAGRTTVLASGVEVEEGNNELFVFRREGGEWRIHRYLFATNQSPA